MTTPTPAYRLAVRDGGKLFHYDQPDYPAAYAAWVLLRDHGRDEAVAWIEQRNEGGWTALEGHYPVPESDAPKPLYPQLGDDLRRAGQQLARFRDQVTT